MLMFAASAAKSAAAQAAACASCGSEGAPMISGGTVNALSHAGNIQ